MADLSVIQEYMLCAVNDKGVISAMDTDKQVCLVSLGLAEAGKAGLLGSKTAYVPRREAVGSVVEMLRAEVLEDGTMTEDAAALTVMLERGKCLKPYFSAFEQKEIREKLRRITASPEGRLVKEMAEYVEVILAAAVSGAVASGAV